WHATHDEFETGADQLQAHWLVWLGALVILAAAMRGTLQRPTAGYRIVVAGALGYLAVAVWHFYEHTQTPARTTSPIYFSCSPTSSSSSASSS
ncbi:MAG TPA: hypothetical protein VE623_11140, partial [Acidimicrobiales bacterium]|nr:hypothetical protein [Acidimicrobiales bacterium]